MHVEEYPMRYLMLVATLIFGALSSAVSPAGAVPGARPVGLTEAVRDAVGPSEVRYRRCGYRCARVYRPYRAHYARSYYRPHRVSYVRRYYRPHRVYRPRPRYYSRPYYYRPVRCWTRRVVVYDVWGYGHLRRKRVCR